MGQFNDPSGLMRTGVIALYAYLVFSPISAVLYILYPVDPVDGSVADLFGLPYFLVMVACFVLVGRWIYRTNANAHLFEPGMSISPGWSVGWFFIPFANLIKPYEGVSQAWSASHDAAGLEAQADTALLRWWWGLWLATNILSTVAVTASGGWGEAPNGAGAYIELTAAILNVPLCLVLIRLMKRLTDAQLTGDQRTVFA